jgi:enoyl-CoA hydratase/carnithine racemase
MSYFIEREAFYTEKRDRIAIIKIKDRVFDLVTDIYESENLMEFITQSEYDNDIAALLFLNEPGCYGEDKYDAFIHRIMERQEVKDKNETPTFSQRNIRFREINILNNIIRGIAAYQKLCFIGINGEVVTPFIGAALAADFRFASKNSRFVMAHNKFGLHPSGALPFFLAHYMHHSTALSMQLSHDITVERARELGLVNEIFPSDHFDDLCIEEVRNYLHCRSCTIRMTKKLTNFSRKDLNDYFQYEAGLLNL